MNSPFFSIIIPTYNSGKTLYACLESVVNQSFQNFEVIIIDGVSSDDTFSIAKHYQEINPNIRWFSEKDNGIYDAINMGIKMTKGEWIYFLGSDDKVNNNQVLQKIFSLNKSGYEVIYGNAKIIGDTSWAKDGELYDGKFDLQKLLKKNICHQAIFYNIKCFGSNSNFNLDYKLCADWDFNLRCWANKPFLYINLVIVDFYAGGESTQYNADEAFSEDFNKNMLQYFGANDLSNFDNNISNQKTHRPLQRISMKTMNWLKSSLNYKPNSRLKTE